LRRSLCALAVAVLTLWTVASGAQPAPREEPQSTEANDEGYEPLPDEEWRAPSPDAGPPEIDRDLLPPPPEPPPPPPSVEPPEPAEVDIITEAGEFRPPPERQPSITLEEGQAIVWKDQWRPFELGDWIFTGASMGVAIAGIIIPPAKDRWMGRNAFDNAVRNVLRPNEQSHRNVARDASDIFLMLSINQVLIDTLVVTWWGHDAETVAWNMALMDIEAIAFNTSLNQVVGGLASRERPYRVECDLLSDENLRRDCRGRKRFRSFYSGHTSTTFAVAGLTCMHHMQMPLYGGGIPDVIPCVGAFAIAGATGTLRIVADQHWATDVLAGAAMGTFSGLAIPYLLHYGWGEPEEYEPGEISVSVLPLPTGGMVSGVF